MVIPYYLKNKLLHLNISTQAELIAVGYLRTFQWLRYTNKSLGFQALFDLYKMCCNVDYLSKEQEQFLINQYKSILPSYPMLPKLTLEYYLNLAQEQAISAQNNNEVPIGAVIVADNIPFAKYADEFRIIGTGYNLTLTQNDITAHAEIIALKQAMYEFGTHRLINCDLYVTLEPCVMCLGAIIHSRIRRIIFGALEPKTGGIQSQYNILTNPHFNHHTEAIGPINNRHYAQTLKNFMQQQRKIR